MAAQAVADAALLEMLREEQRRRDEIRRFDWSANARPEQRLPEGDWRTWLILAGRGFGKTRTGTETVRELVTNHGYSRIALIGPTAASTRDVMVLGESGLLSIFPEAERPVYEPSKARVTFANGATAHLFSAEEPDRLRGPAHDLIYADELAAWAKADEVWAMAMMGLRVGKNPRVIVTTTPRPIPIIKQLLEDKHTYKTRGRTLDNAANLPPAFLNQILERYQGTRLGRQELDGEVLGDIEGAYWHGGQLEALRVDAAPELRRIVVAVDPAATATEDSDYTAIVVAGLAADGQCYVLQAEHHRASPDEWSRRVWALFDAHNADRVILETNQGGDMGVSILRQARKGQLAPVSTIQAKRGKTLRAEPVAHLYELGRVHHVGHPAPFKALEDEMCEFPVVTNSHDDLVDALVHAITELTARSGAVSIGRAPR